MNIYLFHKLHSIENMAVKTLLLTKVLDHDFDLYEEDFEKFGYGVPDITEAYYYYLSPSDKVAYKETLLDIAKLTLADYSVLKNFYRSNQIEDLFDFVEDREGDVVPSTFANFAKSPIFKFLLIENNGVYRLDLSIDIGYTITRLIGEFDAVILDEL